MARKKHVEVEEAENHERWLVTYADMITLLMVLFIVLFSMATLDANKFTALKNSLAGKKATAPALLAGAPSVLDGGQPSRLDTSEANPKPDFDLPTPAIDNNQAAAQAALQAKNINDQQKMVDDQSLQKVQQQIQASLGAKGIADEVQFHRDPKGLVVTIVTDKVLFDTGKADIKPQGAAVLDALADPLRNIPNQISIEGHTDNQPISGGQFPSNWELSTTRATSVLRYLVDHHGVPASRVSAAGYADQRPVAPNDTDENRAKNRRVEVVILTMAQ